MRMALYDRWHVHRCWPIRPPHNSRLSKRSLGRVIRLKSKKANDATNISRPTINE